ncbi:MAG TPA: thiamine phosphate synthase, partial [Gammaproteobacteria bacterium]
MIPFPRRGLYAITPDREYASGELETAVRHAIDGGAVAIQYRSKQPDARRHLEAAALAGICRECSVPLIINDDVALAAEIEAGGAHVGKDDLDLKTARSMLGSAATIGVSCYASAAR